MTLPVEALAVTVPALAAIGAGFVLLKVPHTRPSALALVLAGVAMLSGLVLMVTGSDAAARLALILGGLLLLPLALVTYPRAAWRHPVEFVLTVLVVGAGLLAILQSADPDWVGTMALVSGSVVIVHLWWASERGGRSDRQPLVWVSLALGVALLATFAAAFIDLGAPGRVVAVLLSGAVPVAMGVGARRPEVVDARGLLVRFVVALTISVGFVAVVVTAASLIELAVGRSPSMGWVAVIGAIAAFGVRPIQVVLRGVVDELLFGRRPDPLRAATRVVDAIGDDPVAALAAIRETLVLPYTALRMDGQVVGESGVAVTHTRRRVLDLGGGRTGELVVGLRPGDLTLTSGDEQALLLVTPLLAQALRVRALADELQASRGQAIAQIEEDRRRLRRDLHDGLGPRLTGIAFTTDAARNAMTTDPDGAAELLRTVREETASAIADVRTLVYAMRPPALDELGLVGALRQQVALTHASGGTQLAVSVEAPDLPPLSAAVEVATFRIVTEAVANAARHAGARRIAVSLSLLGDALEVVVHDEGGTPTSSESEKVWRPGVGLTSMRERAAELGGTLEAGPTADGGRVRAVLPLG